VVERLVRELPQVGQTPEPATAVPAAAVVELPADDSDGPEWPDESVEAAMRAEQRDRDFDSAAPATVKPVRGDRSADAPDEAAPLPKLDTLIEQIPPAVRDTLEDLFRARFTSVQRVPKTALK
jgi:hypothetical protein